MADAKTIRFDPPYKFCSGCGDLLRCNPPMQLAMVNGVVWHAWCYLTRGAPSCGLGRRL